MENVYSTYNVSDNISILRTTTLQPAVIKEKDSA